MSGLSLTPRQMESSRAPGRAPCLGIVVHVSEGEEAGNQETSWRMEDGGWRMEDGGWKMEV